MSYVGHMLMFPNLCLLAESLLHIAAYSGQEPACSLISHVCEMFSCIAFTLFYMQYVLHFTVRISLLTLFISNHIADMLSDLSWTAVLACAEPCVFFSANRSTLSTCCHYQIKKRGQLWLNEIKRADWTETVVKNAIRIGSIKYCLLLLWARLKISCVSRICCVWNNV